MPFAEPNTVRSSSRTLSVRLRRPDTGDGAAIWQLARRSGLDENSPYAYLLWAERFADTSVVAEVDDDLVGFISGFRVPRARDTVFVWQIGVDHRLRGRGVASAMLDHLVDEAGWARWLEATVTPSNEASASMFRRFAARHRASVEQAVAFSEEQFPAGNHETEVLMRIGPLHH